MKFENLAHFIAISVKTFLITDFEAVRRELCREGNLQKANDMLMYFDTSFAKIFIMFYLLDVFRM